MTAKQTYKAPEPVSMADMQSVTVNIPGLIPAEREGEFILRNVRLTPVHSEEAAAALGLDLESTTDSNILDQIMALRDRLLLAHMLAKRMEITGIY